MRLVIDTDVAQASGEELAVHPTAKRCGDFLRAVRRICHQVVMTKGIYSEWERHSSGFATRWLRSMFAQKKVIAIDADPDQDLRHRIERFGGGDKDREAMMKDLILIQAALKTDRTVVSLDKRARELFAGLARHADNLNDVVWVNPVIESEKPIGWLEAGAKPEEQRMLGFLSEGGN